MRVGNVWAEKWIMCLMALYGLMVVADALYSTTPDSKFKAMDPTSLFALPAIELSPSGDKLAISYLNLTGLSLVYKTLTLQGVQQCRGQHTTDTRYLIGWPRDYGLMFLANDNVTVNYFSNQCDNLERLVQFEKKPYKMSTSYRDSQGSVVALAYKNAQNINYVSEYSIKDGQLLRSYEGWKNDTTRSIQYSSDGQILFMSGTFSNWTSNSTWQQLRISSPSKDISINSSLIPKRVIHNQYQCIGLVNNDTYVKMDEHNHTQIIHVDKLEESEVGGRICAGEDVLLVVRYTNGVEKVEMLVYSTKDGLLEQTILLDFIPAYMTQPLGGTKLIQCNDHSLVLLGADGVIRIYHYSTNTLPVYAIVLISVAGGIILLAVIVCAFRTCQNRRKQSQRNREISQYSKFSDYKLNSS